ncbi:hypothetical protein QBC42DRAFT_58524 [Cladorrhinum samala]|uniref:Zinc finger Mcm10/DnaG-type domain-containing protein n=1 Tax=Cladorrhinum samala TaxID=585594 RepID=A0AAV9HXB9_9PEZI|nr:hypothetical protein QBC42DRAFT_58524 [Cladorrhinum samala]
MAAQWPPRSPHEVLMSTPGGREKLRRLAQRASPSPSPSSKLRTSRSVPALAADLDDDGDELMEDDDDEVTLQLKLQEIQAQLKLRKLQKAKRAAAASDPTAEDGGRVAKGEIPFQSKLALARERIERPPPSHNPVEVPASPVRKHQSMANLQESPKRVLLGIDKGRKAADMSLGRPTQRKLFESSSTTTTTLSSSQPVVAGLRRAWTPTYETTKQQQSSSRPLSFNDRLSAARVEETTRQEQRERVQKARSKAFSVGRQEMEEYKSRALDVPEVPYKPEELSRAQILASLGRSVTEPTIRPRAYSAADSSDIPSAASSFTTSTDTESAAFEAYSGLHLSKRILPHKVLARAITGKKTYVLKDLLKHVKAPDWSLPDIESDIVVFAIIANKSEPRNHRPMPTSDGKPQQDRGKYMVITLVDLTYEVELYLFNTGFDRFWKLTPGTVLAILNPTILPPPPGREATNRFGLVINSDEDTILEVGNARDIGYCKSVKKDGTLCNGWINARRTEYCEFHTNEAVRKARSSRMELNTAGLGSGAGGKKYNSREMYMKKQEQKTENYDRFTGSRFFVSSGHRGVDPEDERENGIADRAERQEALKRRLAAKEKERDIARQLSSMGGGAGKEYMSRAANRSFTSTRPPLTGSFSSNAASSFPAGPIGSSGPTPSSSFNASMPTAAASFSNDGSGGGVLRRYDSQALGLTGRRGTDAPKIDLGPIKRKRPQSSASSSTVSGLGSSSQQQHQHQYQQHQQQNQQRQQQHQQQAPPEAAVQSSKTALGWGSALKTKLGRMRDGERLDGRSSANMAAALPTRLSAAAAAAVAAAKTKTLASRGDKSPVRKKTRFVTEKGIREAGRESLGDPISITLARGRRRVVLDKASSGGGGGGGDDDDELIIVR